MRTTKLPKAAPKFLSCTEYAPGHPHILIREDNTGANDLC